MYFKILNPKQSLNKAYLKQKISRENIELFKKNFGILTQKINPNESEEHLKNIVSDFLKDTWYKDSFEINTKGRNDLVIHTGKSSKDPVGLIIEVKRPGNTSEMFKDGELNVKALHELVLYYLRERIDYKNTEIRYLVVTNIYEWYIIDELWFEINIYRNAKLRKDYENWLLSGKDTRFFYESIVKPMLSLIVESPVCTHFNIKHYEKLIKTPATIDDNKLISLYKILSPAHLLKQRFVNDSNKLDENFYKELLHIIGLEEKKISNKWIIQRKETPDDASLLENTMIKLEDKDCLTQIGDLFSYGSNRKEQLFNIALELCITWVNRILFIKLLEAQIFKYNSKDKSYLFLNSDIIFDFNELNNLFFQVLAEKLADRRGHLNKAFEKVPYLNSSLFDRISLEKQGIDIGSLDNRLELPLFSDTVLKDLKGKKRTGYLSNIEYLFEFLDSYDFTSEGGEEIQEENKNLINASVLGLIFEKINGYKDGSFYTPGFITMYMCKQTIRHSIINKFNEKKGWSCETLTDLHNKIDDKIEANYLINNHLKICDPAVGSGHFLVSALNEIILIKSELNILLDRNGKTLKDYFIEIANDELVVLDGDGNLFEYNPKNREHKRVQETLFHEKEIIIENCLFGVDINENSVKICRLRLWIELLKNTYYKDHEFLELETLPNIDINIKCGNSLLSRFELTDDLSKSLKNVGYSVADYKNAVAKYKVTKSRKEKNDCIEIIEKIKGSFKSSLDEAFLTRIAKARGSITKLESDINTKIEWRDIIPAQLLKKLEKAKLNFRKAEQEKKDILNNVIFRNCFEWRFEFPEVLNTEAEFEGFDVIIGNPPWGADIEKKSLQIIKKVNADIVVRMVDSFMFFINQSFTLKNTTGIISMIIPDVLLYQLDNERLRSKILEQGQLIEVINLGDNIFHGVARASAIVIIGSDKSEKTFIGNYRKNMGLSLSRVVLEEIDSSVYKQLPYSVFATENIDAYELLTNLPSQKLGDMVDGDGIQRGVSPDLKAAFVITQDIVENNYLENYKIKTTVTGGTDVKRFQIKDKSKKLIYTSAKDDPKDIKNIYNYLEQFVPLITCKEVKEGKHPFYALHRERDEKIFLKREKILGVITSDKIITALDVDMIYPTDGIFVLCAAEGISNKFLISVLNSKLATYIYRLLSFEEGRALAQIKPSILKDIPVPFLTLERQRPFITLVDYLTFLNDDSKVSIIPHTSNERVAASIEEVLNMMVYELYFEDHMKENNINVIELLDAIPFEDFDDEQKASTIFGFYSWFQAPENPIRQRIILSDTRSKEIIFKIKTSNN